MRFYLYKLVSRWPEIFMYMQRLIIRMATEQNATFFLVINVQNLFSFGTVLIFRTHIANIMAFVVKNMLCQEQDGRKSPL